MIYNIISLIPFLYLAISLQDVTDNASFHPD